MRTLIEGDGLPRSEVGEAGSRSGGERGDGGDKELNAAG